jgi:hypothetical protein
VTSQTATNVSVELSASILRVNKEGDTRLFGSIIIIIIIIIISSSSSSGGGGSGISGSGSSSKSSSSSSSSSSSNIRAFYSQTNAQVIILKTILKFTLKQPRQVSVQSHHLQGAHYPCLLKMHFVKIVNYGTSVCD